MVVSKEQKDFRKLASHNGLTIPELQNALNDFVQGSSTDTDEAIEISYNNAISGLIADNVQDAIDELKQESNDTNANLDDALIDLQSQTLKRQTALTNISLTTLPAPIDFITASDLFIPSTASNSIEATNSTQVKGLKTGYYKAKAIIHAQRSGAGSDGIVTFVWFEDATQNNLTTRSFYIPDTANTPLTFEFEFSSYIDATAGTELSLHAYADTTGNINLVANNGSPPVQLIIEKTNNLDEVIV